MGPIGDLGRGILAHHPLILTYMPLRAAYGLSEDPGLTTYFFPGRDGVGGNIQMCDVVVVVDGPP